MCITRVSLHRGDLARQRVLFSHYVLGECEIDHDDGADYWQELEMCDESDPRRMELGRNWHLGVRWSCCGGNGRAFGCCRDKHDAADRVKRLKEDSGKINMTEGVKRMMRETKGNRS